MPNHRPVPDLEVSRTTLRQRTLDTLRTAILDRHFLPGARLTERELCEATGVSRTSVREALRSLESEGLVSHEPHRGFAVAGVTAEEARQIYEVRALLEGHAGRQFARLAADNRIADLEAAFERYRKAIQERDARAVNRSLADFYEILFDGAGNAVAGAMIRSLRERVQYLRAATTFLHTMRDTRDSIRKYRDVVAAAKRRDPDAMALACRCQVAHAGTVAQRILGLGAEDLPPSGSLADPALP